MSKRLRWIIYLGVVFGIFLSSIGVSLIKDQPINWPVLIPNISLFAIGLYYLLIFRREKQTYHEVISPKEKKDKRKKKK